nr:hypothetical protein [Nisaea sp.]
MSDSFSTISIRHEMSRRNAAKIALPPAFARTMHRADAYLLTVCATPDYLRQPLAHIAGVFAGAQEIMDLGNVVLSETVRQKNVQVLSKELFGGIAEHLFHCRIGEYDLLIRIDRDDRVSSMPDDIPVKIIVQFGGGFASGPGHRQSIYQCVRLADLMYGYR